jgi:hypothetical protein
MNAARHAWRYVTGYIFVSGRRWQVTPAKFNGFFLYLPARARLPRTVKR